MGIFDYQASITVTFDKEILTDPAIVIGTEYYTPVSPLSLISFVSLGSWDIPTPIGSVFDGNIATYGYHYGAYPHAVGKNFGSAIPIKVFRLYTVVNLCPKDYKIQYSNDGSSWVDIATGQFTNTTGWQTVEFAEETHQYWRLYYTSSWTGSTWARVYELLICTTRPLYNVSAWTVISSEYNRTPDGQALAETYTVRKVTKAVNNLSVTLWLDMFDRMEAPIGDVIVAYNKDLGNLAGDFDAEVASFSLPFTPHDIVPAYLQPHDPEYLSANMNIGIAAFDVTYRYIPAESATFLVPDQDNSYMDENISAISNFTVVVTKVGELPL